MAAIKQRAYLRVGVDQTTLFFGYRDASGNLAGFDDAVAQQVAKAIFGDPNKIRYTVITSAQRIPDVQHGAAQAAAAARAARAWYGAHTQVYDANNGGDYLGCPDHGISRTRSDDVVAA
jgi:ABC-type amino acid transport substrate-binding protein